MLTGDEPGTWVPPGPGLPSDCGVDLDAQTPRLRTLALRAAAITGLWLIAVAFVVLSAVRTSEEAQHELSAWTPSHGMVIGYSKTNGTVDVSYPTGKSLLTAEVPASGHFYSMATPVEVRYDPVDPARVRTVDDIKVDEFLWPFLIPIALLLLGTGFAVKAALGWFQRYRAVRRTGWHPASVQVHRMARASPLIDVQYPKAGEIVLRGIQSTRRALRYAEDERQRAWVGGERRAMVVLFPRDHLGKRPYAVPVWARMPRYGLPRTRPKLRRK
ncbi:hypothetical protein [Amycolatopsis sp. H20-H5]|uniref:hypothetical protein n=1 Tax=Amycolatopsis sp. H20-H5 TaxID=3046309 RepID=UPI002DBC1600|nr:hypothetical protein [Amycolatopsis sp. H20-H5]MEC3977792.1 hypothetical protein [Amycolatopsis sp. H20-H5]